MDDFLFLAATRLPMKTLLLMGAAASVVIVLWSFSHWRAAVKVKDKPEAVIDGTQVNECPVTFVTPESLQMIELIQINRVTKPAALFGPDTGRWPAWLADATMCIEAALAAEEQAKN